MELGYSRGSTSHLITADTVLYQLKQGNYTAERDGGERGLWVLVKAKRRRIDEFCASIYCALAILTSMVTIHSRPVGMTSQAGISPLPDRV